MAENIPNLDGMPITAQSDVPDIRDHPYEPALVQLARVMDPPADLKILNQGTEGACTGFGLAAVINKLNQERGRDLRVSARMLYEMAKRFDAWPGELYSGSSCRGAIKGWFSMGVCSDDLWKYRASSRDRYLTVKRAKDARSNTIGAYYRIRPEIVHMHAALNEAGAVYVSATVHEGWKNAAIKDGHIIQKSKEIGGHAFAIVGYDESGFWIQNSWGESWGAGGLAHWSYEDWQDNVRDAWVLRLALPTPQIWARKRQGSSESDGTAGLFGTRGPRRDEIAGHFAHIDDGQFHEEGRYWSSEKDVETTAGQVASSSKYEHLMFYAHGGLNSTTASATRVAAMKQVWKDNRIYPYHFMYDTGLMEEIKDIILGKRTGTEEMVGGISDWWDAVFERLSRRAGRALWREMKSDASLCFRKGSNAGRRTLGAFIEAMRAHPKSPKKIHLVGHSTGGILIGHLLAALSKMKVKQRIASVSLLAPAATVEMYESNFLPYLEAAQNKFGVDKLNIYNLDEKRERDDNVVHVYRKSLLYLVSNAFEEERCTPLLGMQEFSREIANHKNLRFIYSPDKKRSQSESHGGFDNDPMTMNDILATILGGNPRRRFSTEDLDY